MTDITKIPNELKQYNCWACYQKATKMLVSAISGFTIQSREILSLTDYQTAYIYYTKHKNNVDGIAFVLPQDSEYVVIGIDIHKNEIVKEWLELNTYAEYSMNKDSVNIICRAKLKGTSKVSYYGIDIITDYICLTGDRIEGYDVITDNNQNKFDSLYDKYFRGIVNEGGYSFSKKSKNADIPPEQVRARISSSLASNMFYTLNSGDYRSANFTSINQACLAFFSILIFFTGGNYNSTMKMFKDSDLYKKNKDIFNTIQGDITLYEYLYNVANKQQECVYNEGEYHPDNYSFNRDTGITKVFKQYSRDDTGNAQRVFDKYKSILRYEPERKSFYLYNEHEGIWEEDSQEDIRTYALINTVLEDIQSEFSSPRISGNEKEYKEALKNYQYLCSYRGKKACIAELKAQPGIWCSYKQFDNDDFLLNTRSGVVNLKNGQLLDHNKDFMMTMSTRSEIDLVNQPTRFLNLLKESMLGDVELIDYLQKLLGYCCTGVADEQQYYIFRGEGGDGKSLITGVVEMALGDYALHAQPSTFLKKKFANGSNASPDVARMLNKRLVLASEPAGGMEIDDSFIKQFSGQDIMTARELYKGNMQFKIKAKLILLCNNLPKIAGTSRGDWRRVRLIEWLNSIPDELVDTTLHYKIEAELPQILGWLVQGCIKWQREKLIPPSSVKTLIEKYKVDQSVVAKFIQDVVLITGNPQHIVLAGSLYSTFRAWGNQVGEDVRISQTQFGTEFGKYTAQHFVDKKRLGSKTIYTGIKLIPINDNDSATNFLEQSYHFARDMSDIDDGEDDK